MVTVGELMSDKLVVLHVGESLENAEQYFKLGHIRHLPVVRQGKLVGLLTQRDLLRALVGRQTQDAWRILVGQAMTTEVTTVSPETPLAEAVRLMLDHKFGCLPVIRDGTLVGMITDTDLLRFAARREEELHAPPAGSPFHGGA